MSLFTPASGLIGGGLIGLSAGVLLLGAGEILGASGLASSLLLHPSETLANPAKQWKAVFLCVFFSTSMAISTMENKSLILDVKSVNLKLPVVSELGYMVAGFLVGLGTKLGNGCTTGHGICGMARLSMRSLVYVISFMSTGIISATLCGTGCPLATYLRASPDYITSQLPNKTSVKVAAIITASLTCMTLGLILRPGDEGRVEKLGDEQVNNKRKLIPAAFSGAIFAAALAISGMIKPSKIYGFLDLSGIQRGTWDPTLLCVMGAGLVVSMISYQFVKGYSFFGKKNLAKKLTCPVALKSPCGKFEIPTNKKIDAELIMGGSLFGLAWGIGGSCPGPALWLAASGFPMVLYYWLPCFCAGSFLAEKIKEFKAKAASK